ncbi:tripartite tricarboxylate transporter substrate binding protein [Cupriavidus sp. SW-Y-13]|uniref:Bug family tripartite tricarboxylate transporter substrate binding protein n=1 Tax=Cupriavidus sp. SW-Y-13 TaxID=2653854 RepID=UPI00136601D8|nr:tripartite tricarboxylate transporter substrate binding protein [Cupriavidus sp. SW-Y-13]MWL91538.1 tripartite tricarboxylate transporter substrate binding protein [Cupriavidus sp. SW-Y-13]
MARKVSRLFRIVTGTAALVCSTLLSAQTALPSGAITMVVGWPAGGPSDSVARLVSAQMSKTLGQSIVIDNRAGAGGNIGSDIASRAKPDGGTIMLATATSHGLNSALYSRLNYDPIKDFAPIGLITTSPGVMLVPKDSPYRSVAELVAKARAQPGQLNYGSGGVGSSQHLAGAVFKKLANVDVAHIPFKGTAPAMTDLMAGRVDFIITTGALPFIRSGKVRPLAVAAHQRLPVLPDVPTFEEAGVKGFYTDSWYGLVAPANTPRPALEKLNAALNQALRDPELQKQFSEQGSLLVKPMGVDEYWTFVKKQMPSAAEQVRISGAKAD